MNNNKFDWDRQGDYFTNAYNAHVMVHVEVKPGLHPLDSLTAPTGWDNYLKTGNFKGCLPIIKPGARINTSAFEAINFEMV